MGLFDRNSQLIGPRYLQKRAGSKQNNLVASEASVLRCCEPQPITEIVMTKSLRVSMFLPAVFLFANPMALAQDVKGEVAGGYSLMYDNDLGESFPAGWFLSGGANFSNLF